MKVLWCLVLSDRSEPALLVNKVWKSILSPAVAPGGPARSVTNVVSIVRPRWCGAPGGLVPRWATDTLRWLHYPGGGTWCKHPQPTKAHFLNLWPAEVFSWLRTDHDGPFLIRISEKKIESVIRVPCVTAANDDQSPGPGQQLLLCQARHQPLSQTGGLGCVIIVPSFIATVATVTSCCLLGPRPGPHCSLLSSECLSTSLSLVTFVWESCSLQPCPPYIGWSSFVSTQFQKCPIWPTTWPLDH